MAPAALATTHPAVRPALVVTVLSNRADLVSGDDALVDVVVPPGVDPSTVGVAVDGRDRTASFTVSEGHLTGLVDELALGSNEIVATAAGATGARLTVVNHPRGGPVFSGRQVQPWKCQTVENGLGPALDAQCNAASVTRDVLLENGVHAAYERGAINRGIYELVVPANWNGKLIWAFGAGTGQVYAQGTPGQIMVAGVPGTPFSTADPAVLQGFAIASSTMTENSQHSNDVTSAETVMMVKEHLIEHYGPIRFTIGQGGSGGALQQYLVADAYPGLLNGLRPTQDWTDQLVGALREFGDCRVLVNYMQTSPLWTDTADRVAVFGHGGTGVCDTSFGRAPDYFQPDDGTDCAGDASYASDNPRGVRCTLADLMAPVFGQREEGCAGQGLPCARRPWDNVGVQYGLVALRRGEISLEQFVDLNDKVGGLDINMRHVPGRSQGDTAAIATAHRTGRVVFGRNLSQVPIVVTRSTNNNDYHYAFRSIIMRNRLDRANGTHANQVLWTAGTDGTTLELVDAWLTAIENDHSTAPLAQKVLKHRPPRAVDACWIDNAKTTDSAACDKAYPIKSDTRVSAGEKGTSDLIKCRLRPLRRADYGTRLSSGQWDRLRRAFPSGVCDYGKPGVGQPVDADGRVAAPTSWVTFAAGPGGLGLGPAPTSVLLTDGSTKSTVPPKPTGPTRASGAAGASAPPMAAGVQSAEPARPQQSGSRRNADADRPDDDQPGAVAHPPADASSSSPAPSNALGDRAGSTDRPSAGRLLTGIVIGAGGTTAFWALAAARGRRRRPAD